MGGPLTGGRPGQEEIRANNGARGREEVQEERRKKKKMLVGGGEDYLGAGYVPLNMGSRRPLLLASRATHAPTTKPNIWPAPPGGKEEGGGGWEGG